MNRRVMPLSRPSWGIDVGNSSLKVVKVGHEEGRFTVLERDEYEYPCNLSHPEAHPEEMVSDAVAIMMNRHKFDPKEPTVVGLNSSCCLLRFFGLPPIATEKIFEVVEFESRQQIPFPLEEVYHSWQQVSGSPAADGFTMDAAILLIAAKKNQVFDRLRLIEPLRATNIQPNVVALFNALCAEQQSEIAAASGVVVLVSVGSLSTDLIVAELCPLSVPSKPLWQRNIPLGGQHWTKQLAKELKLTFAKAEYLKRNVSESQEISKARFRVLGIRMASMMNLVTADLLLEIQRSLGFFLHSNPKTTIDRVLFVGPAITPEVFENLKLVESHPTGNSTPKPKLMAEAANPSGHQERISSVEMWKPLLCQPNEVVAFGLALQGLGCSQVSVGLMPPKEPLVKLPNFKRFVPTFRWPFVFDRK